MSIDKMSDDQENIIIDETTKNTENLKSDIFQESSQLLAQKLMDNYQWDLTRLQTFLDDDWTPGTFGLLWTSLSNNSDEAASINEQVQSFGLIKSLLWWAGGFGDLFSNKQINKTDLQQKLQAKLYNFMWSEIWQAGSRKRENTIKQLRDKMQSISLFNQNTNLELNQLLNAIKVNNPDGIKTVITTLKSTPATPAIKTENNNKEKNVDENKNKDKEDKEKNKADINEVVKKSEEVNSILETLETKWELTKIDEFRDSKGNLIFKHKIWPRTTPYIKKDVVKDFIGLTYDFYQKTKNTFFLESSFRTAEHQQYLLDNNPKNVPTAGVNHSRHNVWIAIDISKESRFNKKLWVTKQDRLNEFRKIAKSNNFLTIPSENWHFEHITRDKITVDNIYENAVAVNESFGEVRA